MNKSIILTSFFVLCTCSQVQGQNYLDHLQQDQQEPGVVKVHESKDIDDLVNNVAPSNRTKSKTEKTPNKEENKNSAGTNRAHIDEETGLPIIDTRQKVLRQSHKIDGYRIQVYQGNNSREAKLKAQNIVNAIKQKFPTQPVYVHFYTPKWTCRMGNFRSYEEAAKVLAQIKSMGYQQACILKGKITVQY